MFVRGGRQRLAPRGHGELHALAAHGDRGLQRGRVAGGHGGCGERATGCLGSARVRGVPMASRIAEMAHSARNEDGGGIGGEDGRRTRAFARGERHDAGGDMRSRLVGGVHAAWDSHRAGRGEPRADRSARQFTLFAWKSDFFGSAMPNVRGEPKARNPKPVRGFASSHPLAPRCPRVPSGCSPAGASLRAPPRASSAMGRPVDAPAPARPGCARACPPRRAASAGRDIGTRRATAAPCRCGGDHLRGPPRGGPPVIPSPGKPSTRRLPRTPRRPPRSTRAP